MSVVLPGSAQLVAGSRKIGRIALRGWLGLLGLGLLGWWVLPRSWLLGLAVRPWALTLGQILCVLVAVVWATLLLDAWRLGYPPGLTRRHRLIAVGTTLALCALVVFPPLKANRMLAAQHTLVATLFTSGTSKATDGRVNVLVLGGDSGKGRIGLRPDSINLVSIDESTGEAVVFSLPRNLEKARFPNGTPAAKEFPRGFRGDGRESDYLLNAVWTYGEANPKFFPGAHHPGATATMQAVGGTLGVEVHYYVLLNLDGFRDLINALGGVTINVKERVPIGQKGRVLKPGKQHLDGYEALWYARSREGSSDYARMARQRCVIDAVVRQADPSTVLANFEKIAASATGVAQTDIPQSALPQFVDLALKTKSQSIVSLQFVPPLIKPSNPDFGLIKDKVQATLEQPTERAESDADKTATAGGDKQAAPSPKSTKSTKSGSADQPDEPDPPKAVSLSNVCD